MKVVQGNLQVGRYRGAPLLFHWSLPIGLLAMTRFRWVPGAWIAFLVLVLIHEFGHAFLVKRYRLLVTGIQLHGLGGECRYVGAPTARQTAVIAWGGVLGQVLLLPLGVALPYLDQSLFMTHLAWGLTTVNLTMIGINLIPIPPLDGAEAWKLPRMWWRRRKQRRARAAQRLRKEQQAAAQRTIVSLRKLDHEEDTPLPPEMQEQLAAAMQRAKETSPNEDL